MKPWSCALVLLASAVASTRQATGAVPTGDVFVTLEEDVTSAVVAARRTPIGGDVGTVFVDGVQTAFLAPGMIRDLPAGPHTVRVDHGCRTASVDLTVRPNAIERVALKLATGTGSAMFFTSPYGATVSEGGCVLGTGPFGPVALDCGTHTVVTTDPGRLTASTTFEVPLRGSVDVKIELAPAAALGGIAVVPTPIDAIVIVDGKERGAGPMTLDGLPLGVHLVGARLDGYLPAQHEVVVVANQIVRASVELFSS